MPKKRANKKSPTKAGRRAGGAAGKPAARARGGRAPAAADAAPLGQLERLIELMVAREVVEVEYEEGGARWRVRRAEAHAIAYAQAAPMPVPMPHAGMAPVAGAAPAAAAGAPPEPQGEVFKSPMVGTFYRAPSPEAEAFCKPGDHVSSDRTLCIIEAMKVMNEIKAEREFEVVDVLVKNGESVEFGQPLFLIR